MRYRQYSRRRNIPILYLLSAKGSYIGELLITKLELYRDVPSARILSNVSIVKKTREAYGKSFYPHVMYYEPC